MKSLTVLLLVVFLLAGCESDDSITATTEPSYQITLEFLPRAMYGVIGDTIILPITARVYEGSDGRVNYGPVQPMNVRFIADGAHEVIGNRRRGGDAECGSGYPEPDNLKNGMIVMVNGGVHRGFLRTIRYDG